MSTTSLYGIRMDAKVKFVIVAFGIFFSYFCFGILHEKITRSTYGDDFVNDNGKMVKGERFRYELTLVGIQCLVYTIFARVSLSIKPDIKPDKTNYLYYVGASIAYLSAMVASTMALRSLSYPMQVVGKSAKPIPVMILATLIGGRRYFIQSYFFVLLIVVGIIVFFLEKNRMEVADERIKNHSNVEYVDKNSFGMGEMLLIVSLSMDGVLGAIQERIRSAHAPTGRQMMLAMNSWGTIILSIAAVVTFQIFDFALFIGKYPEVIYYILLLCVAGSIGQTFIFTMISSFGSLPCSIVTTLRKFLTVLFSVIFYMNPLNRLQWFAVVLVFSALLADTYFGRKPSKCSIKSDPEESHEAVQNVDVDDDDEGTQDKTKDEKQAEPVEREKMLKLNEMAPSPEKSIESLV